MEVTLRHIRAFAVAFRALHGTENVRRMKAFGERRKKLQREKKEQWTTLLAQRDEARAEIAALKQRIAGRDR